MDDLQDEAIEQTVDEESSEDSQTEDSKLEKRWRDGQSHISKLQNENKELRSKLDQIVGRLDQLNTKESKEDQKLWIDEIDDESIRDDPSTVKQLIKRQRQEIAELLEMRDRAIAEQMRGFDPELRSSREKIAKLREDPELKNLPDEALLVIAKKFSKDADEDVYESGRSSGAPIGSKRSSMTKKAETHDDKVKKFSPYFDRMYGKQKSVYGGKS